MRWAGLARRHSISTASWLIAFVPIGSFLHSGAPTKAASGIAASAFGISFFTNASSRASPRTTSNVSKPQHSASEVWPNMKLSSTVTEWPARRRLGTSTEPRYPAPPVTRIFKVCPLCEMRLDALTNVVIQHDMHFLDSGCHCRRHGEQDVRKAAQLASSSPEMCCASAAEPPLPQTRTGFVLRKRVTQRVDRSI